MRKPVYCCLAPPGVVRREIAMAKGQMRSNKEKKKPKAAKPAASPVVSSFLSKGTTAPAPKKKG
jgi:hypothetical protein